MAAVLYDAAFGTLGRLYGHGARSAITTLTLFGGLASTICWPISPFLLGEIGCRGTCLAYAAVQLCLALLLYLVILPRGLPQPPVKAASIEPVTPALQTGSNLPTMVVLAATLSLRP